MKGQTKWGTPLQNLKTKTFDGEVYVSLSDYEHKEQLYKELQRTISASVRAMSKVFERK